MSIACPACRTRFRDTLDHVALARALQCGTCDHVFTRADAGLVAIDDAPSIAPSFDALAGNAFEGNAFEGNALTGDAPVAEAPIEGAADGGPIRSALPVVVEMPTHGPTGPRPGGPLHVDIVTPPSAIPRWRWAMPALAAAVLAAGMVALAARGEIMHRLPGTVALYQMAGLAPAHPGLAIGAIETASQERDGIRRLIVRGEIENVARHAIPVPRLELTVRGRAETRLHAWTVAGSEEPLAAGARRTFTAVTQDLPDGAVDVNVRFAPASAAGAAIPADAIPAAVTR